MSSTPPALAGSYVMNFNTLMRAAEDGALCLLSAIRKSDGKAVALVCGMQTNEDGTYTPVPFAVMCEGDPFEDFEDPTKE